VQGQLRNGKLTVQIESECAHCGEPLHLEVDSDLNYQVQTAGAAPVVYSPRVNFQMLEDPSIIDAY
jgi:uncharacterized metal-binding protein YceD (DUF177 family)